jgi:uroporphyrinogen decarboxylase
MVEVVHAAGKKALLHSCGNLSTLMDEIIDDLHYDGKHSYEDNILPVEQALDQYGKRIAILGGIDLDWLCNATPEQVTRRASALVERSMSSGGYALGSGNSIPEYVPEENYFAMIAAATGMDYRQYA